MTDNKALKGSCLCGKVRYEVTGNLGIFQYCHCSRCQKVTGSAFAANMLVLPDDFKWLDGEEYVGRYELASAKHYATSFCKSCGSFLPWAIQSGKTVVVPAGTLDDCPPLKPTQNVFCASRAKWYESPSNLPEYDGLPAKKG